MSVIDSLITDRTAADVSNRTAKGLYNATDINRVSEAILAVAADLNAAGYTVTLPGGIRTDWAIGDLPTASDLQPIAGGLAAIREAATWADGWPDVPSTLDRLGYESANNMEELLLLVDADVQRIAAAFYFAGDLIAGEV